jgi:hypothetical protein
MNSPQQFEDNRAERLARLEANVEILMEQGRENRAEPRFMVEQLLRIRTTDFRVLVGLIITCNLGTIGVLYKLLAS